MRTGSKEMNDTIAAGRRTIELAEGEIEESAERRVPPVAVMAGVVAAVVGLGVLGWMIYRRRQRRNLIRQIQDVFPDYVDYVRDLPGEIRSRVKAALWRPAPRTGRGAASVWPFRARRCVRWQRRSGTALRLCSPSR